MYICVCLCMRLDASPLFFYSMIVFSSIFCLHRIVSGVLGCIVFGVNGQLHMAAVRQFIEGESDCNSEGKNGFSNEGVSDILKGGCGEQNRWLQREFSPNFFLLFKLNVQFCPRPCRLGSNFLNSVPVVDSWKKAGPTQFSHRI